MKTRFILLAAAPALMLLLVACSSTAHIEKDDNTDFSRYKTFAWTDSDGQGTNDKNKTNDLIEQKIREAVTKELVQTAGWKEAKNRPDVLISYDVLV